MGKELCKKGLQVMHNSGNAVFYEGGVEIDEKT